MHFCANNTGNEVDDQLWGETVCISDGSLQPAGANSAVPEVQRFVQGSPALAMPDNLAWQPGRGGDVAPPHPRSAGRWLPAAPLARRANSNSFL